MQNLQQSQPLYAIHPYERVRNRAFEILNASPSGGLPAKIFQLFIITLITLNVLALIIETAEDFAAHYSTFFHAFELLTVTCFSLEYLLRLWSCTSDRRYRHPVFGRLKFAFSPFMLIDLMATLPFYLPLFLPINLVFLRLLRLYRLLRLFSLARYYNSLTIIFRVLARKREEVIVTLSFGAIMLVISSSLMYFVEHGAQPKAFSSIPATMWWGVTTLTTVGYGDMYPVTPLGRLLGAIIAILGVGMFALPTSILSSGFMEELQNRSQKKCVCPNCGSEIDK